VSARKGNKKILSAALALLAHPGVFALKDARLVEDVIKGYGLSRRLAAEAVTMARHNWSFSGVGIYETG
jgi:hypothetical protein